jgi:hypothetical protein
MKYIVKWSFLGCFYAKEYDCLVAAVNRAKFLAKGLAGTSASLVVIEVL